MGFHHLNPAERHVIAVLGGKAAHAKGTAHKWNKETAALAGAKGGATTAKDKAHMAEIGRKGGQTKKRHGGP